MQLGRVLALGILIERSDVEPVAAQNCVVIFDVCDFDDVLLSDSDLDLSLSLLSERVIGDGYDQNVGSAVQGFSEIA